MTGFLSLCTFHESEFMATHLLRMLFDFNCVIGLRKGRKFCCCRFYPVVDVNQYFLMVTCFPFLIVQGIFSCFSGVAVEEFELRVGKDICADIASIHNHTMPFNFFAFQQFQLTSGTTATSKNPWPSPSGYTGNIFSVHILCSPF